jgi:hypothetical protein
VRSRAPHKPGPSSPVAERPEAGDVPDGPRLRYDPGFREAVEAGHLTAGQAYARGKREAYAQWVRDRYGVSAETAYAVADNRVALRDVAPRQPPDATETPSPAPRPTRAPARLLLGLALLAMLLAAAWLRWGPAPEPSRVRTTRGPDSTAVHTDAAGSVVRVIGLSPEDVLDAFCREAGPGRRLGAAGLMPAASDGSSVRIGLLRDASEPDALLAIAIRRDRSSGRWFAGDGVRPLVPHHAPLGAGTVVRRDGTGGASTKP